MLLSRLRHPVRHRVLRCPRPVQCFTRYSSSESNEIASLKPYYITTPIFYPNAAPHIGHLYTLVLGDIFARYQRLVEPKREVKLLVGTDEHGMKIQQASAKAGVETGKFCDELSEIFRNLSQKANINYTTFARTTQERHRVAVEHVWKTLADKGYIYKGEYEGWYSITDECFYTTPQVTQTAEEVFVSKETGSKVEWTKEHNYMFRLSAFQDALLLRHGPTSPVVPSQYSHFVHQALSEPLSDISISRPRSRLTWGIQVPEDPEHTIYVWFDALLIYLSGVGYPQSSVDWPADLQIIGKDILRFHAIYLPAMLLALSGPQYSQFSSVSASELLEGPSPGLPKRLLTHGHWTVSQAKMSKSVGNVVEPLKTMEKYGVDIVRFYLARVGGRFRNDVDWSFTQLEKHSKELQSLLGNYLLRITSPGITQAAALGRDGATHPLNSELLQATRALPSKVQNEMDEMEISNAIIAILDVLKLANTVMTDIAPWSKTCDPSIVLETRQTALLTLRVAAVTLRPFIPSTAEKLMDALDLKPEERTWESVAALGEGASRIVRDAKSVKLF